MIAVVHKTINVRACAIVIWWWMVFRIKVMLHANVVTKFMCKHL